jgi:predicted Abi (CAAX) family protease
MSGQCCVAAPAPHRLARRLSTVTASILPAAGLVFLPKCPLCLAAWLTVATGVSFSTAGAAWVHVSVELLCVAALASVIWRRALGGASAFLRRLH